MGFKLAADVDLQVFCDRLDEAMGKRDEALKEWFRRAHANPKRLSSTAEAASAGGNPILLDLGGPSGGLAWAVQQVICAAQGALTATAAANVTGAVFVGGIPSNLAQGIDLAGLSSQPLTVPFLYPPSTSKALIVRQPQRLYVVLQGAGTNANGWLATATAVEIPDTIEALSWL